MIPFAIQYPVEFRVDGLLYRFRVSRWSNGDFELTCISEEQTDRYRDKRINEATFMEAVKSGKVKIIY